MDCKNKKTLKRRIRRIISICILITVLLFGVLAVYMTSYISKSQALFVTRYYSNFIGSTMNSEYFLKQLEIKGLEEFDASSPTAAEWIESLKGVEKNTEIAAANPDHGGSMEIHILRKNGMSINIKDLKGLSTSLPFMEPDSITQLNITLNGSEIYRSPNWDMNSTLFGTKSEGEGKIGFFNMLMNYFKTESSYPLLDSNDEVIGNVRVRVDPGYIMSLYLLMAAIIVFIGLVCLMVSNLFSKFFTISITKPLNQLNDKIKAIASGDYKSTLNSQIVINKPLMEIESLAYSTNEIMHKMREYSEVVESQKQMLENQNTELEAQNEELLQSRSRVEQTQALLVQSEKMASIGQLTAAITHEINTPLGAINSNTQLFAMLTDMMLKNETLKSDEELSGLVSQLEEANKINVMACERVIQIIKSLKTFTKLDQAEFQEADINDGIKSVLILTSNLWKRKITIHECYGSIPQVKCYSGLLNQVFMNIIVNAIQAMDDKGDIYITTYNDTEYVYVSVKDTGTGINPKDLPHIFDNGFSTKSSGTGAGLGLAICSNIIEKHNGSIKVMSEGGKGSEFIVSIPIHSSKT